MKKNLVLSLILLIVACLITPSYSASNKGSITVDILQNNAKVFINGRFCGIANGPSVIDDLLPGTYTIAIDKYGYERQEFTVTLKMGEQLVMKIDLTKGYAKNKAEKNPIFDFYSDIDLDKNGILDYKTEINLRAAKWMKFNILFFDPAKYFLIKENLLCLTPMFTFRDFAIGIGSGVDTKKADKVVLSLLIKELSPNDRGIAFSLFFIPGYIKFLPFPSYAENLFNINLSVTAKYLYTKAHLYTVANNMTYSGFNQGVILYLKYFIIKPELGFNLYQTKIPGSYLYSYSANIECVITRWKNVRFTLKPGIEFNKHQEPLFDLRIGFEYRQR